MRDYQPLDVKRTLKTGLIYLAIAFVFMLITSTILTILKVPVWLNVMAGVVVGGIVVFICYLIHNKLKEKKKQKRDESIKFDPFKD